MRRVAAADANSTQASRSATASIELREGRAKPRYLAVASRSTGRPVPAIAQAMFDALAPGLTGGPPVVSRTVSCRIPEGDFAADLTEVVARHARVSIGSYPYFRAGKIGVSLVVRGVDPDAVDRAAEEVEAMVRRLGGEPLV